MQERGVVTTSPSRVSLNKSTLGGPERRAVDGDRIVCVIACIL